MAMWIGAARGVARGFVLGAAVLGAAALTLGSVPACQEADRSAGESFDPLPLDLSKTCGSPGETLRLTYFDRAGKIEKLPEVTFQSGVNAPVLPSRWERPVDSNTYSVDVTIPEGAQTGPIKLVSSDQHFDSPVFTIPCPPDAGLDGATDADAAPNVTGGFSESVVIDKTGSPTSGNFSLTPDGKVLMSATAGDANLTEVDPSSGAAKQTSIPNITVSGALRRSDGSTMIVGRSGISPLAARIGADNTATWAWTFGEELERAVGIASLDAETYLVPFAASVLKLPASGTGAVAINFDMPPKTNARAVEPLTGGGFILGAEVERTFPEQDLLVIAMTANDTIQWQRLFADGGRQSVRDILGLVDGGALLVGSTQPAVGADASYGWLSRLAADGAVVWQRTYGMPGGIVLSSALETAAGLRVLGSSAGGLTVMELNGDGSVVSARRFKDPQPTAFFQSTGIGKTALGEIVFGGFSPLAHTYQVVKTSPDLTFDCADALLQAPLDIASASSTLVVTTPTHVVTTAAAATTPVSVTPGAPKVVAPVDQCTN